MLIYVQNIIKVILSTKNRRANISSLCLFTLIILLGLYCTPKGDSSDYLVEAVIGDHHPLNTKSIVDNQASPKTENPIEENKPWANYNSITSDNVDKFMLEMRDYVFKDLVPVDFNLEAIENWYTVEYPAGREPIRGAFNPGGTHPRPGENPSNIHFVTTYYNVSGGVVLNDKRINLLNPQKNINYPEGTVIAQLDLFTYKQPWMDGAPTWKILGKKDGHSSKDTITVWLSQFEIALKYSMFSKSDWSYLKYAYHNPNYNKASSKKKYENLKYMAPVGANWISKKNGQSTSVFSKSVNPQIKKELTGKGGNLTTVGQKDACCTSCHASAQWNKSNLCCNAGSNLAFNFISGDPFKGKDWVLLDNDLLIKLAAGSMVHPPKNNRKPLNKPFNPCEHPCSFQK